MEKWLKLHAIQTFSTSPHSSYYHVKHKNTKFLDNS